MRLAEKTAIGVVVASLVTYTFLSYPRFYPFPDLTSVSVAPLLRLVGIQAASLNRFLIVGFGNTSRSLAISGDCAGVIILIVFIAVIFLSPYFKLTHKFTSFIFIPLVLAGNILRIFIAVILGNSVGIKAMLIFHNTAGNVFMFMWAVACYLLWLTMIGQGAHTRATA